MARWKDERPPYLRFAADLRASIMSGDLAGDGDRKLPSIAKLMEQYNTNSTSVIQRALVVLQDEGLIVTRQGKGSYVRAGGIVPIEATPGINLGEGENRSSYQLLKVGDAVPPADAARALGIQRGAVAVLRKQVLVRSTGMPVELVWNYYPTETAHGTALTESRKITGGSKALFAAIGREQSAMDDVVATRPPTTEEVEALELPVGVSVLRTLRTITDRDGGVMEVSVIVKGGHLYALRHHRDLH